MEGTPFAQQREPPPRLSRHCKAATATSPDDHGKGGLKTADPTAPSPRRKQSPWLHAARRRPRIFSFWQGGGLESSLFVCGCIVSEISGGTT